MTDTDANLVGHVVCVKWYDIVTWGGWTQAQNMINEAQVPHVCETYGYYSFDAPYFIVVSATKGTNGTEEYNQHVTIPKGCIIDMALA